MMLAVVLCAQALNFGLVLMVRLPAQPQYALSDIAAALRSDEGVPGLTTYIETPPAENEMDERDRRMSEALAARLGIPRGEVRVVISRPPQIKQRDETRRERSVTTGPVDSKASSRPEGRESDRDLQGADIIVGSFAATVQLPDGRWRSVRPNIRGIEPWQWQALLWLVGSLMLAAPIAWLVARRIAAPIDLFAAAAERLGRDPGAPELQLQGPRELVTAARAFNAMQLRLQRYVEDRTTMVAAIAHDLRTPLMRLSLMLEDAPESVRSRALAEIREMKERIGTILAFMRGVSRPANRQKLDLRILVESVVDEMTDRGCSAALEPGTDITIEADVAGIKSLVVNLLDNAVRHAHGARVALKRLGDLAVIEVTDKGPGIPEGDLELVFQPFYRVGPTRVAQGGSIGLGLASVRAVARAHGGEVTLRNLAAGGLVARVTLPI